MIFFIIRWSYCKFQYVCKIQVSTDYKRSNFSTEKWISSYPQEKGTHPQRMFTEWRRRLSNWDRALLFYNMIPKYLCWLSHNHNLGTSCGFLQHHYIPNTYLLLSPLPMPLKTSQIKTIGKNIQNRLFGTPLNEYSTYLKVCQVPPKIQTVTEVDLKTLPSPNTRQG